jgi:predicted anti-sigma-YlaC factor YlaD
MRCEEFLEGFSEYLDDFAGAGQQAAFNAHLRECQACRRYHRVVQQGLELCGQLPHLHSSPDFLPRLKHRLYHVDDGPRLAESRHLGSAALIAVASVGVLALAWLPFATRVSMEVTLPPVAVSLPASSSASQMTPALFSSGPFVIRASDPAWDWRIRSSLRAPVHVSPKPFTEPTVEDDDSPTPAVADPSR